jgi:Rrf2 family protein
MRSFNAKTRYALLAALDLARHRDGNTPIKKQAIVERTGIPAQFLAHILRDMKHDALAGSSRGATGGYWLMRPPETITAADVVMAVRDRRRNGGTEGREPSDYDGAVNRLFETIDQAEVKVLRGVTLAQLLQICEEA